MNDNKSSKKDIGTRGMEKIGRVVSSKARKTAVIEIDSVKRFPKYKRWAKSKSKMSVHVPEGIKIEIGDLVSINETRKISKTKSWTITKIVKKHKE